MGRVPEKGKVRSPILQRAALSWPEGCVVAWKSGKRCDFFSVVH